VVDTVRINIQLSIEMDKDSKIMTISALCLFFVGTLGIIALGYLHGGMHIEAVWRNLHT